MAQEYRLSYTAAEIDAKLRKVDELSAGNYLTSIPSEYVTESELNAKGYLTSKPTYTKSEVGLGNVDNVKQYSASNEPPYPVTSVNGKTGAVVLTAADIGVDASSSVNTAISSHNTSTSAHNDLRTQISQIASATGVDTMPSYWQAALDEGVESINVSVEAAGRNKSTFLWYTDAHWGYGSKMSPKLLSYLREHTAINKINFGGDFGNDYGSAETGKVNDDWLATMREFRQVVRELPNHHSVLGNHDANGSNGAVPYFNSAIYPAYSKHIYGFVMAPEETPDIVRGGDFYYYIDDPNEKTRYLYLNTSFCYAHDGYGEHGQGQFVADALASTKDGWHIVAISHIWFRYESQDAPTVGTIPIYCQTLLDLFDKYNSRKAGNVTLGNEIVTYDFTDKAGTVEFCIGGHIHVDYDFTSTGGIPVILTRTDSYHWRPNNINLNTVPGTTDEAAVNAIVADYDVKQINIIRIGKDQDKYIGATKIVPINHVAIQDDGPTNYTNQLRIATDSGIPGDRYGDDDTPGYMTNTRISVSDNTITDKTEAPWFATGFIPATPTSIIRLKNCVFKYNADDQAGRVMIVFADEYKELLGNDGVDVVTNYETAIKEDDGNIVQFKLRNIQGLAFIRIVCQHLDNTSIITVDEEIN